MGLEISSCLGRDEVVGLPGRGGKGEVCRARAVAPWPSTRTARARRLPGAFYVADFFAMLDERERALEWLETAVNRGFINHPYLSKYDPFFAKFRDEERFKGLLIRVKAGWERFEE